MPEDLWLLPVFILFLSFSFFLFYFFLHGRKASREEGEEEAQGIRIFTLEGRTGIQRPHAGAKSLIMMSWAPRCLATSVSRGAKGWEGVGPPVLHGEDWGAPSLARDTPPPPLRRVNGGHKHSSMGLEVVGAFQPPKFHPAVHRGGAILAARALPLACAR